MQDHALSTHSAACIIVILCLLSHIVSFGVMLLCVPRLRHAGVAAPVIRIYGIQHETYTAF